MNDLTFGDETSGTVDTSRVELDELQILQRKAGTRDHGVTITSARVCTCAREVGASVATSSQDGLVSAETVKSTVLHVQSDDTNALAILHDQVEREVLDEEVGVVAERLAVEGVEESVTGTVGGGSTAVCLTTLSVLQRLTTEGTLVDLALLCSREGDTEVLKLMHVSETRRREFRDRRTSMTVRGASRHM